MIPHLSYKMYFLLSKLIVYVLKSGSKRRILTQKSIFLEFLEKLGNMSRIFYVPMGHFDSLHIFHFRLFIDTSLEMEKFAVDANRELWT